MLPRGRKVAKREIFFKFYWKAKKKSLYAHLQVENLKKKVAKEFLLLFEAKSEKEAKGSERDWKRTISPVEFNKESAFSHFTIQLSVWQGVSG